MAEKFKRGARVKLVGSSTVMTVTEVDDELKLKPGYYKCSWFEAGNRLRQAEFHEDALVEITDEDDSPPSMMVG